MKEQLAKDAIAISNETPSDVNNNEPFTFVIDNLSAKNLTQIFDIPDSWSGKYYCDHGYLFK